MNKKVVIGIGTIAIVAVVWNYMSLSLADVSEDVDIPLHNRHTISVETTNTDIEFVAANQDNITIAITGKASRKYKEMTKLAIKQSEKAIELTYKPSNNSSVFAWNRTKNLKMKVSVPNKMTDITIKTSSGDQIIKDITAKQSIICKTTSGDIDTDYIQAAQIEMMATSGDIVAKNITSEQNKMTTTSGDVTLHNSEAQKTTLHATSGDIIANELKAVQLHGETTSGEQTFRKITTTNATMMATSGDLTVNFIKWNGAMEMYTTSGQQNIQIPKENQNFTVEANATSGDIVIDIGDIKQEFSKETTIKIGQGTQQIQAQATSGDIIIHQP